MGEFLTIEEAELKNAREAMKRAKALARELHVIVRGEDGLDGGSDYRGDGWHNFPDGSFSEQKKRKKTRCGKKK